MSLAELKELVKSIHELRDSQRELSLETHRVVKELTANTERAFLKSAKERDLAIKQSADERDKALKKLAIDHDLSLRRLAFERDKVLEKLAIDHELALRKQASNHDQALRKQASNHDRALRKLAGDWHSQWGQLVEALVEPGLVRQFRDLGIDVTQTAQRLEGIDGQGRQLEVDVLLVDGDTVVAIEVKSKCKVDDIDDHEDKLMRFKEAFSQYADKKVLGGVAAVVFDSDCHRYAFKRGLFALKPVEGIATILNSAEFKPKEF